MSDTDKASKTEEPTPKKLREAHAEGNFARAPELTAAFTLAAAFAVFAFFAPSRAMQLGTFAEQVFRQLHTFDLTETSVTYWMGVLIQQGLYFLFPLLAAVTLGIVAAGGLQTGFRISPKALEAKLERLSPAKGVQKLFSPKKGVQLLVDLGKFIVVAAILYAIIQVVLKDPLFSSLVGPEHLLSFLYETFMQMLLALVFAVGAIAAIHLIYQKQQTHAELRMTKQEVKDEMKNQEGDPMLKSARRRLAQRLMQRQMLDAVPDADVVVTNPTHYAVALRYEAGEDPAPIVLAKGHQRMALRIKKIAADNGVPMVENRLAARLLYRLGTVGEAIPGELYETIAEILSHVYRAHKYYFYQLRQRRLRKRKSHG